MTDCSLKSLSIYINGDNVFDWSIFYFLFLFFHISLYCWLVMNCWCLREQTPCKNPKSVYDAIQGPSQSPES